MNESSSIIHQWMFAFWEHVTLEMFVKFAVLYFFILWIALIVWVARDISNRTDSIFFQVMCILLIIIMTPLGIGIYLMIRPGKTLFEKYYHEIDENLDMFHKFMQERASETYENMIDETVDTSKKQKNKKKQKKNKKD